VDTLYIKGIDMETQEIVKQLYSDEGGSPFILTPKQVEIFEAIYQRKYPRVHTMTYTQFGKSLTVALAVLTRIATFPEKWAIVAPSNKKAHIIMGYIIDHIFDNEYTSSKFAIGKDESREKIRRERRKDRINLRHSDGSLGECFVISTEGRRIKDVLDALMGFGAANIVLDESSLVEDPQYAGVLRMLGGTSDNFIFEIGNPMRRNHFFRTWRDTTYHKIFVDSEKGIEEGRITRAFIEEMRRTIAPDMFSILYECKFPDATTIDDKGYSPLLTELDLDRVYQTQVQHFGAIVLGVDVAGGGNNYSVVVKRSEGGAEILYRENNRDTMNFVGIVLRLMDEHKAQAVLVDEVGIGRGVADRLKEQSGNIYAINNGERPEYEEDYKNIRGQSYWRMATWIKGGGQLKRDTKWEELLTIRWKIQSDRKVQMKPKAEMLVEGIMSPDVADALALTFAKTFSKKRTRERPKRKGAISPYETIGRSTL